MFAPACVCVCARVCGAVGLTMQSKQLKEELR